MFALLLAHAHITLFLKIRSAAAIHNNKNLYVEEWKTARVTGTLLG